jgi:hypothetical protein
MLLEALEDKVALTLPREEKHRIRIVDGELRLGGGAFSARGLAARQVALWENDLEPQRQRRNPELTLAQLTLYALSRLGSGAWIDPADLTALWRLARPEAEPPHPDSVCEAGWRRGCLAKTTRAGRSYYALAATDDAAAPGEFLDIRDGQAVGVDLQRVPVASLERLSRSSSMKAQNGRLLAVPDLVRMGRAPEQDLQEAELSWLRERHPAFRAALAALRERRGKTIVHENLLIAQIKDMSLKVLITRKFPQADQVVALSDQFIAFPHDLFNAVQSLVRKSGHAVKMVRADQNN